jgi:inner membrane protein
MVAFLDTLVFWHWWILGIGLVVLEVLAPGVIFLWVGIGAGLTGLILLVQPTMAWEVQLVLFGVLSVVSGIAGRVWVSRHPTESDQPLLNQRGAQYVGRTFTLEEPITDGTGKVKVDDSIWRIVGEDAPVGSKVKVVGSEGASLMVEGVE